MQPISIRYLYNSGFAVETASHFLIFDYSNYASWRNALEKLFDPTIFAIHCQKALENAIAYERRYLNNPFSEYIDSILGQKKRYKSLNN